MLDFRDKDAWRGQARAYVQTKSTAAVCSDGQFDQRTRLIVPTLGRHIGLRCARRLTLLSILIIISVSFLSCQTHMLPEVQGPPPSTTLANVPVNGDTVNPTVTLYWNGHSNSGYISGAEYRYITYHLVRGDSVVHDWSFTKLNPISIILESSDQLNEQYIEVRAVDNYGQVDPSPARLILYTHRAYPPRTIISSPVNGGTYFVLSNTTDWWQGIPLSMSATDSGATITEYGWSIDGGEVHWTTDSLVYIKPSDIGINLEGYHTISVTSRNNLNLVDSSGKSVVVQFTIPRFTQSLLLVNETNPRNFPSSARYSLSAVDSFYISAFKPSAVWDVQTNGLPPKAMLGNYKVLLWVADDKPVSGPHLLPKMSDSLQDYLNVGGNIIVSGWQVLSSFNWGASLPQTFKSSTFPSQYLHVVSFDESPSYPPDFTGAHGVNGFQNVTVDTKKLSSFPFYGKETQVTVILQRGAFARPIFAYLGTNEDYAGRICGIMYVGTVYKVVVLGFPLFFLQASDVQLLATELMEVMK